MCNKDIYETPDELDARLDYCDVCLTGGMQVKGSSCTNCGREIGAKATYTPDNSGGFFFVTGQDSVLYHDVKDGAHIMVRFDMSALTNERDIQVY